MGAVLFAHDEFQVVINAVKELAAAKPTWTPMLPRNTPELPLSVPSSAKRFRGLHHHHQGLNRYVSLGS